MGYLWLKDGDIDQPITLVDLWPHTGRWHQLRLHMRSVGHAIVGDRRHGCRIALEVAESAKLGLMLAAVELVVPHIAVPSVEKGTGSKPVTSGVDVLKASCIDGT